MLPVSHADGCLGQVAGEAAIDAADSLAAVGDEVGFS
jgi:hypothetical protein